MSISKSKSIAFAETFTEHGGFFCRLQKGSGRAPARHAPSQKVSRLYLYGLRK